MYVELYGIRVSPTDGMGCEWDNPCGRKSTYHLDGGRTGDINGLNLCTQYAKVAMKQDAGRTVMAEYLEGAVDMERTWREIAVQAFSDGWDAAMESMESEEALY